MRPIPVAFHIWFLELHTYGIGLALTFWFGLRYTERRLRKAGYPWQWVTGMFVWVIVAAIVGARAFHVLSNLSYYSHQPSQVFAIWQGGLSSFGGLIFAVPVAIVSARRRCPQLPTMRFADLMAPVLMACWGMGRLLGPQLMVAGGGHPTHQWFGMYYAGQVGKRLPVPIFQSIEDFTIFGILLLVERWLRLNAPVPGSGDGELSADSDSAGRCRRRCRRRCDPGPIHRVHRRGTASERPSRRSTAKPPPPVDGRSVRPGSSSRRLRHRRSYRRPASSSAWEWSCGGSSVSSTNTCGWVRTAIWARSWSRGPASSWPSGA